MLRRWLAAGLELDESQLPVLEARLTADPDDREARGRLVGYLASKTLAIAMATQARPPNDPKLVEQLLWLIDRDPQTMAVEMCAVMPDAQIVAAWRRAAAAHPDDPRFPLCVRIAGEDPTLVDADYERVYGPVESDDDHDDDELPPPRSASLACRAPAAQSAEYERFSQLSGLALDALERADLDGAHALATECLALAPQFPRMWNQGNAIYSAHETLGQVALERGDLDAARRHCVLAATETPGSPQLNSFGPTLRLAAKLLERGERTAIYELFAACRRWWRLGGPRLDAWSELLQAGTTPDFGAHLVYRR